LALNSRPKLSTFESTKHGRHEKNMIHGREWNSHKGNMLLTCFWRLSMLIDYRQHN